MGGGVVRGVQDRLFGTYGTNEWAKKAEVESGSRAGVSLDVLEKLKAQEREIRALRQANEILRKPSAYFGMAELDRRSRNDAGLR